MTWRRKIEHVRLSSKAIRTLWREELSFRIQVAVGAIMIFASFVFGISPLEFALVIAVIGTVLAIEAINTAIEEICDHVTPEHHPSIGKIKDLGSAASLLFGIAAAGVGIVIFVPALLRTVW